MTRVRPEQAHASEDNLTNTSQLHPIKRHSLINEDPGETRHELVSVIEGENSVITKSKISKSSGPILNAKILDERNNYLRQFELFRSLSNA